MRSVTEFVEIKPPEKWFSMIINYFIKIIYFSYLYLIRYWSSIYLAVFVFLFGRISFNYFVVCWWICSFIDYFRFFSWWSFFLWTWRLRYGFRGFKTWVISKSFWLKSISSVDFSLIFFSSFLNIKLYRICCIASKFNFFFFLKNFAAENFESNLNLWKNTFAVSRYFMISSVIFSKVCSFW